MMKKAILASVLACAALLSGVNHAAQATPTNLLTNGSFETGDLNGWTQGGNTGFTSVSSGGLYNAEDGSNYLYAGPIGSDGILSQTFTTVVGEMYSISGWLIGNGTSVSDFSMGWDGTAEVTVSPVPSQNWTFYSAEVIGTGNDTFSVAFRDDPSFIGIDNLSVSAVPEPASMALFGAALIGLCVLGRRKAV